MAKYIKTVTIYSFQQLDTIVQIGQWFQWFNGSRGQYLGKTRGGVDVIRYQQNNFGKTTDTVRNKMLRNYAKIHGSR